MTPVLQTRNDNCVAACLATLFDLRLDQVPDTKPETWAQQLGEWLDNLGFSLINVRFRDDEPRSSRMPIGYSLGAIPAGEGAPSGWMHCVICKDGKVYFDPKDGYVEDGPRAREYTIIYQQEPTL